MFFYDLNSLIQRENKHKFALLLCVYRLLCIPDILVQFFTLNVCCSFDVYLDSDIFL